MTIVTKGKFIPLGGGVQETHAAPIVVQDPSLEAYRRRKPSTCSIVFWVLLILLFFWLLANRQWVVVIFNFSCSNNGTNCTALLTPNQEEIGVATEKNETLADLMKMTSLSDHVRLMEWNAFKAKFGKKYASAKEEFKRFEVWLTNHAFVSANDKLPFELGMNHLGDMTIEEVRRVMNGYKALSHADMAKMSYKEFSLKEEFALPFDLRAFDAIDWRTQGYVTPVKNQGQCGSCWAFSTTGALEGQHFRQSRQLSSLSEQNLIDCANTEQYHDAGCNGGSIVGAFQYVTDNHGIDSEESYPYEAQNDNCRFNPSAVGADAKGFTVIPPGREDQLQLAVATVGPISVAIDASQQSFQFYKQGVYDEPNCSNVTLDHAVLVVGFGTDENGVDFWTVKNSWSTAWGEQGYIRMRRNKNNLCGIATAASYPLVGGTERYARNGSGRIATLQRYAEELRAALPAVGIDLTQWARKEKSI